MDTKFFKMQPAEVSVTAVTRANLEEMTEIFRTHQDKFPAFELSLSSRIKIVDGVLVIESSYDRFFSETPAPRVVAEPGVSYYIFSDNGYRHFTSDARVKHGVMFSVPEELLVPTYGDSISAFSI